MEVVSRSSFSGALLHQSDVSFSSHVVPDAFHTLGPPDDEMDAAIELGEEAVAPSSNLFGLMHPSSFFSSSVCSLLKYDVVRPSLVFLYPHRQLLFRQFVIVGIVLGALSILSHLRRSLLLSSFAVFLTFFRAFSVCSSVSRRCLSHSSKEIASSGGSLRNMERIISFRFSNGGKN